MADVRFSYADFPPFARAMREAAPKNLVRSTAKALFLIGKSDIEKMKSEQLSGGRLNIKFKGFRNSFKSKVTPSAGSARSVNELQLSEYTGAKPFRLFQTGGDIRPW